MLHMFNFHASFILGGAGGLLANQASSYPFLKIQEPLFCTNHNKPLFFFLKIIMLQQCYDHVHDKMFSALVASGN